MPEAPDGVSIIGCDAANGTYGDVCRTAQAGKAQLLSTLNDEAPPALVILDDVLGVAGADHQERAPAALKILRWLRGECSARKVPLLPCVLLTGAYSDRLGHAFVEFGGAYAFARTTPTWEFFAELWRVVEGARWPEPRVDFPLELSDSAIALLPYLEAGWPVHKIREALSAELGRPLEDSAIHGYTRNIKRQVNEIYEQQHGQPTQDYTGTGIGQALAEFAWDHGVRWISLAYRENS